MSKLFKLVHKMIYFFRQPHLLSTSLTGDPMGNLRPSYKQAIPPITDPKAQSESFLHSSLIKCTPA